MGIEHSICSECSARFEYGDERYEGEICPFCGKRQRRHALGFWGWLVVGVFFAFSVAKEKCASSVEAFF